MEFSEIIGMALPVVYVVVGVVLVWLVIELVATLRKTRKTMDGLRARVEPVLESANRMTVELEPVVERVNRMTEQLEPAVAKVDPLVERVTLTVDAANLEIMRVDQILEDVTQITGTVSNTLDAVDTVTSAPLELVSSVTERMRSKASPRGASRESVDLGAGKAAAEGMPPAANPVRDLVEAAADAVELAMGKIRGQV